MKERFTYTENTGLELVSTSGEADKEKENIEDIKKAYDLIRDAFELGKVDEDKYLQALDIFEKAKKDYSKLKKLKKLVSKDGKVFLQTFYVKTGETEVNEKDSHKIQETSVLDKVVSINQGENVKITNKSKELEGVVSGFSYNLKSNTFWVGIDKEDKVDYIQLTDKSKIDFLEKKDNDLVQLEKFKEEEKGSGNIDNFGFEYIQALGGSTGAIKVKKNGKYYVKKTGNSKEHLANEVRALKYFKALDVPVPNVYEYYKGEAVYTEWVEGTSFANLHYNDVDAVRENIQKYFAAHAVMANHDVVGMSLDNVIINNSGNPVFIDVGGSMGFRAQGDPKPAWNDWEEFSPVLELEYMLDLRINPKSAFAFDGIKKEDILKQLKDIKSKLQNNNGDNFTSTDGNKLKARVYQAIKILETQVPQNLQFPEEGINYQDSNDNVYKDNVEQILGLYKDEINVAKMYGREDIADLFTDIATNLAMTENDEVELHKSLDNLIVGGKEYASKNGLQAHHIMSIQRHKDNSDYMNPYLARLVKNKIDNYNISIGYGKENKVSFDKKVWDSFTESKKLELKSIIDAFKIAKHNKSPDFRKDITVYRGLMTYDSETFQRRDIIITPGVQSTSADVLSSFSKDTKIIISSAEGLSIKPVGGTHKSENEVALKPFTSIQLLQGYTLDNKHKEKFEEFGFKESIHNTYSKYQIVGLKPNIIPLVKGKFN